MKRTLLMRQTKIHLCMWIYKFIDTQTHKVLMKNKQDVLIWGSGKVVEMFDISSLCSSTEKNDNKQMEGKGNMFRLAISHVKLTRRKWLETRMTVIIWQKCEHVIIYVCMWGRGIRAYIIVSLSASVCVYENMRIM